MEGNVQTKFYVIDNRQYYTEQINSTTYTIQEPTPVT